MLSFCFRFSPSSIGRYHFPRGNSSSAKWIIAYISILLIQQGIHQKRAKYPTKQRYRPLYSHSRLNWMQSNLGSLINIRVRSDLWLVDLSDHEYNCNKHNSTSTTWQMSCNFCVVSLEKRVISFIKRPSNWTKWAKENRKWNKKSEKDFPNSDPARRELGLRLKLERYFVISSSNWWSIYARI